MIEERYLLAFSITDYP